MSHRAVLQDEKAMALGQWRTKTFHASPQVVVFHANQNNQTFLGQLSLLNSNLSMFCGVSASPELMAERFTRFSSEIGKGSALRLRGVEEQVVGRCWRGEENIGGGSIRFENVAPVRQRREGVAEGQEVKRRFRSASSAAAP